MKRKHLVIAIVAFVLLVFVLGLLSIHKKSSTATNSASDTGVDPTGVAVLNISNYSSSVDESNVNSIQDSLYARLQQDKLPSALYTANVRQGTLTTTYVDYEGSETPTQVPVVQFLVDIPEAQRTYNIRLSGGPDYAYNILYVLCPTAEQNAYKPFSCTDPQ